MSELTIKQIIDTARSKSMGDLAINQVADSAQLLDVVLLKMFEYEAGDQSAAWINNQGLNTIPETIFLKPWMQFEFENLTALWRLRNQLFEFINETQRTNNEPELK